MRVDLCEVELAGDEESQCGHSCATSKPNSLISHHDLWGSIRGRPRILRTALLRRIVIRFARDRPARFPTPNFTDIRAWPFFRPFFTPGFDTRIVTRRVRQFTSI